MERQPLCYSCIVFHCVESHILFNQSLTDGHLFPNWKWWAMLQWTAEATFLGKSFVHFCSSDRNFQLSISTRNMPSFFTHSLLQFRASPCTFHLAQISYLAKICLLVQRNGCCKQNQANPRFQAIPRQRQKSKLSHAYLKQNNMTWPQPLSFHMPVLPFQCVAWHSDLVSDIQNIEQTPI